MTLPLLGAAMLTKDLPAHRDWLFERDRDLEIQDYYYPHILEDWRGTVDAARKALDGWNGRLGIHGPFINVALDPYDPEARAFTQKRMMQGLDAAEALGATLMVVHSPFTLWGYQNDFLFPGGRDGVIARVRECMAPVVARAEGMGLALAVENIEDRDPLDRVALVEAFDSPALTVSLDTGHAHYMHVSHGGRPADWHVMAAGKRLSHVHVQDVDGYSDRHWPPGRGNVLWRAMFAALARHAPEARLIIEMNDAADVPEGAAYLVSEGLAE